MLFLFFVHREHSKGDAGRGQIFLVAHVGCALFAFPFSEGPVTLLPLLI